MNRFNNALGIDIGGTKICYALIDKNGKINSDVNKVATPKTKDEIFNTLKDIISKFENNIDFIALATAGTVNNENTKVIGSTANLPSGYSDIDFSSLSTKKVYLENDANCAAWAEYKTGAALGMENSITLTLGTGVGGGIIVNGKLLKGKSGGAGEMHFIMSRNSERACTCGSYDCFEAYASGNGLKKTAEIIAKNPNITTYDVIDGVKNNDENCIKALEIWQKDITNGIIGLVNLFDCDCVVLSGSMEKFVDVEKVEKEVNSKIVTYPTKVFHAAAGNYSGMIGAALIGFNKSETI